MVFIGNLFLIKICRGVFRAPARPTFELLRCPKFCCGILSRQNFDRSHSLTSLHLPLAALGSLPTVAKVGKSTGRNLRFLHFQARYRAYRFVTACHTFMLTFLFRFVKRIVSASAPLPLMPTPNNAYVSTVAPHERQRRKKKVNASGR